MTLVELRRVLVPSSNDDLDKLYSAFHGLHTELSWSTHGPVAVGDLVVILYGAERGGLNGFRKPPQPGPFGQFVFPRIVTADLSWAHDRPNFCRQTVTAKMWFREAEEAVRDLSLPGLHMSCVKSGCNRLRHTDHVLCEKHANEGKVFSSKYADAIRLRIEKLSNCLDHYPTGFIFTEAQALFRCGVRRELEHLREVLEALLTGRSVRRLIDSYPKAAIDGQRTRHLDI